MRKNLSPQVAFYLACVTIGIAGAAAAILLKRSVSSLEAVLRGTVEFHALNFLILALPPIGILLSTFFARRIVKSDLSHGVTKVLFAISRGGGRIPARMIWAPLAGCTMSVGFGASLGMEAPIMHAGSAIGSAVGKWLGLDYRRRVLLVGCGTAAAVAAIFKAPVAGALFAIEILMIDFTAQVAIPLLVSSVTGALIAKIVTGVDLEFTFAVSMPFDYRNTPFYILLGVLCALVAAYIRASMSLAGKALDRIEKPYIRALVGGCALAPLILLYPTLFGEGYSGMTAMLSGKAFELLGNSLFVGMDSSGWIFVLYMVLLVVAKGAACSISGSAGGIGGIFAPSLFMGSVTGFVLARSLHLLGLSYASELNFALVGMAGVLAALLKAPLTSVFLIAEITGGYQLLVPLILTSGAAYILGRRFTPYSIYAEGLASRRELVTHHKDHAAITLLDPGSLVEADFLALPPQASVEELTRSALTTRRSSLPVLDEEGFLLGIVRFEEVQKVLVASGGTEGLCVSDFASPPFDVIGPGMGMDKVLDLFDHVGTDELPFIGADGRFIGFISKSRALGAYRAKLLELLEEGE